MIYEANKKYIMKKIMLILSIFLMSSCVSDAEYIDGNDERDCYKIVYLKDLRTGLCFASRGGGITCVPCSKEVEELIKK